MGLWGSAQVSPATASDRLSRAESRDEDFLSLRFALAFSRCLMELKSNANELVIEQKIKNNFGDFIKMIIKNYGPGRDHYRL